MTKVTLASLIEVGLSPRSVFNLALGVNVGSAVWVTTIGGLIMYKNMPRPSFGKIQEKVSLPILSNFLFKYYKTTYT
jgi:hypothetical protein